MIIEKISKQQYDKLDFPILFESIEDRSFAILSNEKYSYKLGWRSTEIDPTIKEINDSIYAIGIDLIFIILDFHTRKILQNIFLESFFYDVKIHNKKIYIITELEIYKISNIDYQVINIYQLPDIFEDIYFEYDKIKVKCMDLNWIDLNMPQ